jgi:hypothetical protein
MATGCTSVIDDTAACTDGTVCTVGDTCSGGACLPGAATSCDDGNVCTDDACVPNVGCMHGINVMPCDDGSACTSGDTCFGGACAGTAVSCDDNNPCTNDLCDGAVGCDFAPATCDDGDPCTIDTCDAATGCAFADKVCDDGKVWTWDNCDASGWYTGTAGACYFDNKSGACQKDSDCTDSNPCTFDVCNPFTGTCNAPLQVSCNDGNPCTLDYCLPAPGCVNDAKVCNDGNAKTADSCSAATGVCVFTPISQPPVNPPDTVKIEVQCGAFSGEVHPMYGLTADGKGFDPFGLTTGTAPYVNNLLKAQLCVWGSEIAVRDLSTPYQLWFGCDSPTKLDVCVVKVNGLLVPNKYVHHLNACMGGGQGNIQLTPEDFGCK